MAAGFEQACEFAHGLLRVLNVFQTFETSYVVKRSIAERQFGVQIAAVNVDTIKPKNLRIKIAAAHIEAGINQTRRQRTFARGYIKHGAARKWFENIEYGVMNRLMSERRWLTPTSGRIASHCH